jgi:hypothetical protein
LTTEEGEIRGLELDHDEPAKVRKFYEQFAGQQVVVGFESSGYASWFEELLESVIEYAMSRCDDTVLLSDLPSTLRESIGETPVTRPLFAIFRVDDIVPMDRMIDMYARFATDLCDGVRVAAAERLKVSRRFITSALSRDAAGITASGLHTFVGKTRKPEVEGEEETPDGPGQQLEMLPLSEAATAQVNS